MKAISPNMIAQLRWIDTHDVPVDYLGAVHQGTLGALLGRSRQFVRRDGPWLRVTKAGHEAIKLYLRINEISRKHPGNMTDRVAAMVKYAKTRAA